MIRYNNTHSQSLYAIFILLSLSLSLSSVHTSLKEVKRQNQATFQLLYYLVSFCVLLNLLLVKYHNMFICSQYIALNIKILDHILLSSTFKLSIMQGLIHRSCSPFFLSHNFPLLADRKLTNMYVCNLYKPFGKQEKRKESCVYQTRNRTSGANQ